MGVKKGPRPYGTGSLFIRGSSWFGQWYSNGRLVKRKLGPVRTPSTPTGLTRRQAESALRKKIADTKAVAGRRTLGDVAEASIKYREQVRGIRPRTVAHYQFLLYGKIAAYFGLNRDIQAISQSQIERFLGSLRDQKLSQKSVLNYFAFLRSVFNFAVKRDWLADNPMMGMDRPRVPKSKEIRALTLQKVKDVLDHLERGRFHNVDYALIVTAALSGLRQGELLGLQWRDIDWKANLIRVWFQHTPSGEQQSPKTDKGFRVVPMTPVVRAVLLQLEVDSDFCKESDPVFAHPEIGSPLERSALRKRFKRAVARSEVTNSVRFHDLRHTFGSYLAAAGAPIISIQGMMGHESSTTTQIYLHWASHPNQGLVDSAFSDAAQILGIDPGIDSREDDAA